MVVAEPALLSREQPWPFAGRRRGCRLGRGEPQCLAGNVFKVRLHLGFVVRIRPTVGPQMFRTIFRVGYRDGLLHIRRQAHQSWEHALPLIGRLAAQQLRPVRVGHVRQRRNVADIDRRLRALLRELGPVRIGSGSSPAA